MITEDANASVTVLQEELATKTDMTIKQQEDITDLMGKVISTESKLKKVRHETSTMYIAICIME